jgi:asparagine N-glycosylation enzyme membrane subunit Stt3
MEENQNNIVIGERKEKVFNFFKNNTVWIFILFLIILVALGVYIRFQPLADHGGKPGLWDYTSNDYTLGPDLDPYLFLRYARTMIENGSLPQMDYFRNVPLGFDTTTELQMVSYMIVLTYKMVNIFTPKSINYAGAFMPVWIFGLTIIAFFFMVREIFLRKNEEKSKIKSGIIATISTFFMIVIPEFLPRTVAGIPEKESVAFFFMFLAFFLFLKSWKSERPISSWALAILAGASTAMLGLTWGGVSYAYIAISLSCLIAFIFNKVHLKESLAYTLWLASSFIITFLFTNRYSIYGFVTSVDTGLATITLGFIWVNLILWKTQIGASLKLDRIKLPKTITTIIFTSIVGLILILIFVPSLISDKAAFVYHQLIKPVTGRWSMTVAENKQPYFSEWANTFGPVYAGLPILFWLFFIGSLLLIYRMFASIKSKDRVLLTSLYALFFLGLVFSRYAPHPALLDGEGIISLIFYFGSALVLGVTAIYLYIKYHKQNISGFEELQYPFIFLFVLFVLTLFTARSAVRLIMVLAPIAPIFVAYILTELGFKMFYLFRNKDITANSNYKIFVVAAFSIIFILSFFAGMTYFKGISQASYNNIPYYYTMQWQQAMSWVRENTPSDAVFAHWWDYGYWLQSIGNRPTVTDGGNAITWWNYLTGRYVLTGDNQKDALEFLYNHNASYLLVDSTDIGKYGAYAQIGSDANYDRLSQGPITFFSDSRNIQETKEASIRTYNIPSGNNQVSIVGIEEDVNYQANGTNVTLFKENTGVIGINLKYTQEDSFISFKQPEVVFYSNGKQINVPLRYVYYSGRLFDFKSGINAAVRIIPRVSSTSIDPMGALIYVSPRVLRGFVGQAYILNNSLGNFNNFQLVHSHKDLFSQNLENQAYTLDDFVYYYNVGLQGPINIWKINYLGTEQIKQDYLVKSPPSYITWNF